MACNSFDSDSDGITTKVSLSPIPTKEAVAVESIPTIRPAVTNTPTPTPSPTPVPLPVLEWTPVNEKATISVCNMGETTDDYYGNSLYRRGDGKVIYVCDKGNTAVYEIDLNSGTIVKKIDTESDIIYSNIQLSDDGKIALYDMNNSIYNIYDAQYNLSYSTDCSGIVYTPVFNSDFSVMYYANGYDEVSMYERDMTTGIDSSMDYINTDDSTFFNLSGVYFDDRILLVEEFVAEQQRYQFIDVDKKAVIETVYADALNILSDEDDYFIGMKEDTSELLIGNIHSKDDVHALMYSDIDEYFNNKKFGDLVVTHYTNDRNEGSENQKTVFTAYDCRFGGIACQTEFTYKSDEWYMYEPQIFNETDRTVYGLAYKGSDTYIYRWDMSSPENTSDYTDDYIYKYNAGPEDNKTDWAKIRQLIKRIKDKYDIDIIIGDDCDEVIGTYRTEYLESVRLIKATVNNLERVISSYPCDFFQQLGCNGDKRIELQIVGGLFGDENEDTLSSAAALYNDFGDRQVIAMDCNDYNTVDMNFYHEVGHAIDYYICEHYGEYYYEFDEIWLETLNPPDFIYDYSYRDNNDSSDSNGILNYEEDDANVYFIDTYSKSFPTEDRARLFEYSLTYGIEKYEKYPRLLEKIKFLYEGITVTFDTRAWTDGFFDYDDYFDIQREDNAA